MQLTNPINTHCRHSILISSLLRNEEMILVRNKQYDGVYTCDNIVFHVIVSILDIYQCDRSYITD